MTKKLTQINNITYYIAGETSTYIALRAGSCSSSWMQISRLSEKFALTLVQNVRLSTSHRLQRGNKNIHSKTVTFKNKQIHKSQHLICLKLMTEFLSRKTVSPLIRKDKNTVFIRLNAASLNLSWFQCGVYLKSNFFSGEEAWRKSIEVYSFRTEKHCCQRKQISKLPHIVLVFWIYSFELWILILSRKINSLGLLKLDYHCISWRCVYSRPAFTRINTAILFSLERHLVIKTIEWSANYLWRPNCEVFISLLFISLLVMYNVGRLNWQLRLRMTS